MFALYILYYNVFKETEEVKKMRKWVAKHASAIVSLVGVLTLIPMVTTCRMFIGQPKVPDELIR